MLQREANLNLNTATAISANLDQLDGAADGQIAAQSFYDRRLLESAVDNQLCEVPSYKRLGLTSDTLGLVQSGCRYDEIDAAKFTMARYLNPNFVEPAPEPAVPVQKIVSERLVAEANNPFENLQVEEASIPAGAIALLVLNRARLEHLKVLFPELEPEVNQLLNAIQHARGALASSAGREVPASLQQLLNGNWYSLALKNMHDVINKGTAATAAELETLREQLSSVNSTLYGAIRQLLDLPTPSVKVVAAELAVEAGPMARAQAAPAVQSLRSAGFSGGPYTRPLLLVAGAAVLIGAGWYWLRDE